MTVWMYCETDGDSGYYNIELFTTRTLAEAHKRLKNSAYGEIHSMEVR